MNTRGTEVPTESATAKARTERLERFTMTVENIRASTQYTDDARRAMIATAYVEAKAELDALREKDQAKHDDEIRTLESALFGVGAVVGVSADPTTKAAVIIAHRDAQDRVARIVEDPSLNEAGVRAKLLELLQRANRGGDEFMARAVADAAVRAADVELLNAFADKRPQTETKIQRLLDLTVNNTASERRGFIEEMEWFLPAPQELSGRSEFQIRDIAERGNSLNAAS
jgi:hypothetical protein